MFAGDSLTVDTVSDQVCLDLEGTTCVENFNFYEIIDEDVGSIIEDISGILGFAKGPADMPSYLEALVSANLIDDPVVTFNLNKDSEKDSTVTMGTFGDASNKAKGSYGSISSTDTTTSISFGDVMFSEQKFQISSGSAFIYVSKQIAAALQYALPAEWSCDDYGCTSNYSCADNASTMPTLKFQMKVADDDNMLNIELPGEAYTWDYPNGDVQCHLMVNEYEDDSYDIVLGNIFLTNFVTTFDQAANTIQLQANVNAPTGMTLEVTQPDDDTDDEDGDDDSLSGLNIGLIVGNVCLLVAVISISVYCCMQSKASKEAKPQNYSIVEDSDKGKATGD